MSDDEKPRKQCPYCPETFSRTDAVTRHVRRKHTADEVYAALMGGDEPPSPAEPSALVEPLTGDQLREIAHGAGIELSAEDAEAAAAAGAIYERTLADLPDEPVAVQALAQIAAVKKGLAQLDARDPAERWGRPWGEGGHGNAGPGPEPYGEWCEVHGEEMQDHECFVAEGVPAPEVVEVTPAVPGPTGGGDHSHAVLEPVTAGEVNAGETIVWLGVRRKVVDRREMVGGQVRLWFGPQHYMTVSRRTPMQRVKSYD